jgi:hypothetical protein
MKKIFQLNARPLWVRIPLGLRLVLTRLTYLTSRLRNFSLFFSANPQNQNAKINYIYVISLIFTRSFSLIFSTSFLTLDNSSNLHSDINRLYKLEKPQNDEEIHFMHCECGHPLLCHTCEMNKSTRKISQTLTKILHNNARMRKTFTRSQDKRKGGNDVN